MLWRPVFDTRPVYVGFVVARMVLGTVYLGVIRISAVRNIPPEIPISFQLCLFYLEDKRAKPGNLQIN
jgi:hypothetical protein